MAKIFLSRYLEESRTDPVFKKIFQAFKKYKTENQPGELFGRDETLERPSAAKLASLRHAHLLGPEDIKASMRKKGVRALRLMDQEDLTSDAFLIYCCGEKHKDHFLLIDILWTNAHVQARSINRMISYAEEAERFYNSGQ